MAWIVTSVFKAAISLLVDKGRYKAEEKLKEGDVTDRKFRSFIVREIGDIESKLEGLARKDLLASISFFKEGIFILSEVFEKANRDRENCQSCTVAAQATAVGTEDEKLEVSLQSTAALKTISLAKDGLTNLNKLRCLDESTKESLSDAKKKKDSKKPVGKQQKPLAMKPLTRLIAS